MTADHIAFHASKRPDAVAFIDNGRGITYSQFNREIRQFMRALSEIGVKRGAWAGIACDDFYLHWVLLLACERLGVATASLSRRLDPKPQRLFENLEIVLSEWAFPAITVKRFHPITPQWRDEVRRSPVVAEEALPPKEADEIVRIIHTTGTTGEPKLLRSPRHTQDAWAGLWIRSVGLTDRSRYLVTMALDVAPAYTWPTAVIRAGGTVVFETRQHVAQAISTHAITHVAMFPIHIDAILDTLPEKFEKPSNLSLTSLGAPLSETLRERAMAKLATFVSNWYGSNEVGLVSCISSSGSGGIGTIVPTAQVEVIDERGTQLPPGQLGRLKIKTPSMHTEYFGDPEATRHFFKDGWFHSSDLAIRHGSNRLQIVGRSDETLNIGGTKVPPTAVEELVLRVTDAKDAGAFSLPNREGVEEIWIAVTDAKVDDKELRERIERGLRPLQLAAFHVVRLPRIPRNPGGKIQRDLLKRAVAEASELPAGWNS